MESWPSKAREFRKQAAEMKALAESTKTPLAKRSFLQLAVEYERLADQCEFIGRPGRE